MVNLVILRPREKRVAVVCIGSTVVQISRHMTEHVAATGSTCALVRFDLYSNISASFRFFISRQDAKFPLARERQYFVDGARALFGAHFRADFRTVRSYLDVARVSSLSCVCERKLGTEYGRLPRKVVCMSQSELV